MCIRDRPWYWYGTSSFLWALCLVVLAPGLLALVLSLIHIS